MRHSLLLTSLVLLLAACAAHHQDFEQSVISYRNDALVLAKEPCVNEFDCGIQQDVAKMRLEQLKNLDLAACKANGGVIGGVGMFGDAVCITHFSDGGKECTNSADCEGECMVYGEFKTGNAVIGQCAAQSPENGGCFARVSNGVVQPGACH